MVDDRAVPQHQAGPSSASAAPPITPMMRFSDSRARVVYGGGPGRPPLVAQGGVEHLTHGVVIVLRHTIFTVISAELRQE